MATADSAGLRRRTTSARYTAAAAARVVVNTRDDKQVVEDRGQLVASWKDRANALGFDGEALHQAARVRADAINTAGLAGASTTMSHLLERIGGLLRQLGGEVVGVNFVVELTFLGGRERRSKYGLYSLISY